MGEALDDREPAPIRQSRLSYALLGVLQRQPRTSHDTVKALEKFRPTQIRQVYPLLSEMKSLGLRPVEEIVQTGKPNRKVYHPTELADAGMQAWLDGPTENPVQRDEVLTKACSMWKGRPDQRRALFRDRLDWLQSEIVYFDARLRHCTPTTATKSTTPTRGRSTATF